LNADATSHDDRLPSWYEGKRLAGGERISVRGSANEGIGDEVRTPLLLSYSNPKNE
jgi:hypothetical protein